jgi:hypothetical protein
MLNKLTNKVYLPLRGEWERVYFQSRVAGGGWWMQGVSRVGE